MDPNGAKFVESAGTTLSLSGDLKITFTDFLLLQRIAVEGSQAIHTLLSAEKELKPLIRKGYAWGASLREASLGAQYLAAASRRAGPNEPPSNDAPACSLHWDTTGRGTGAVVHQSRSVCDAIAPGRCSAVPHRFDGLTSA